MAKRSHRRHKPERGTVADMIQRSVEFYDEDILQEVDGKIVATGSMEALSICFETMLFAFANVIVQLICQRTGGAEDGKVRLDDLLDAMNGENLLAHVGVWADLHSFLSAWLKTNTAQLQNDGTLAGWCDFSVIANEYNRFIQREASDAETD